MLSSLLKSHFQVERRLRGMSARTLANTAWALVVAQRIQPQLFSRMRAAAAAAAASHDHYSPAILSQLYQVRGGEALGGGDSNASCVQGDGQELPARLQHPVPAASLPPPPPEGGLGAPQVDLALQYEAPAVLGMTLEQTAAAAGLTADGEEPSYLEMLWLAGNMRVTAARHWHRSKFRNHRQVCVS
jgi:hypothetical protein